MLSSRPDALTSLSNQIAGMRRHYTRVALTMIAITVLTAGVIHFALALQQVSTRMSALGAEEATLLARTEDLILALKRKAVEPSAGEETLAIIRSELEDASGRLLTIHDEIFALDDATWFGLPIGGNAGVYYLHEPYLIDRRIRTKVEEVDSLLTLDRAGLMAAYESSYGTGGPLVRKMPVTVGIERALQAFQTRAIEQSTFLGWLQVALAIIMIGLIAADALLVFRPLIQRLRESQERINAAQIELDRLAHEDPLTGLANRARFTSVLDGALAAAAKSGRTVGLLQLDLNGFKSINDTLGHAAGDAVLQAVGHRLSAVVRDGDVVARLGGDEYAIVCPELEGETGFRRLAVRIHEAVSQPLLYGSETIIPQTSVGCAVFPDHGRDAQMLVLHADAAMYTAKRAPERSHYFEAALAAEDALLRELEQTLASLLKEGGLQIAYRPVFATAARNLAGLHAVLSWPGYAPGDFSTELILRAAVRSGSVGRVVHAAFDRIAADLADCEAGAFADVQVSIDLPANALIGPATIDAVVATFRARGVDPGRLTIAVAEEALHGRAADRIRQALQALSGQGVRIALSGFGHTFGSIADLSGLPINALHVPAALAEEAIGRQRSAALLKGLVDLAHGLEMTVVGSSVATHTALSALSAIGCDQVEGDLLSGPLTASEVRARFGGDRDEAAGSDGIGQLIRRMGV